MTSNIKTALKMEFGPQEKIYLGPMQLQALKLKQDLVHEQKSKNSPSVKNTICSATHLIVN